MAVDGAATLLAITTYTLGGAGTLSPLTGEALATTVGASGRGTFESLTATGIAPERLFATGAATLEALTGEGSENPEVSVTLEVMTGTGWMRGAVTGAATLEPVAVQTSYGFPRLQVITGVGYGSAVLSATYATRAMNTMNREVTEYQNHGFNSFACIGRDYYAAGPNGLYKFTETADDGTNISWSMRTGRMDDKEPRLKRIPEIVMSLRSSGPVRVRVWSDDNTYYDYTLPAVKTNTLHQHRVKPGKGMRSRYYAVELQGIFGSDIELDSMQVNMTPTSRRLG